ncbi:hypothetical protein ACOME3_009073 [Neoechinorhynchus agilis]
MQDEDKFNGNECPHGHQHPHHRCKDQLPYPQPNNHFGACWGVAPNLCNHWNQNPNHFNFDNRCPEHGGPPPPPMNAEHKPWCCPGRGLEPQQSPAHECHRCRSPHQCPHHCGKHNGNHVNE